MVKEIVFKCDPCVDRGEDSTATHVVPVAIGGQPKNLDLCIDDYTRLLQPVIDALEKYGYTDEPTPKKRAKPGAVDQGAGPYQCKFCPQQPRHIKSFSNHLRQVHDMTLIDFRQQHGEPELVAVAR